MTVRGITNIDSSNGVKVSSVLGSGFSFLLLALLLVMGALPAHAQRYMGSLTGYVSDSTGAKLVGASVTATDMTTNFSTKAITGSNGSYSIPFLTPDTYTVTVQANGFQTQNRTGIVITADSKGQADFTVTPGSASEKITVQANTDSLLDKESADLGTTLTQKEVDDLPNLGRVPFMLASLAAGMYDSTYMTGKTSSTLVAWGNAGTAIVASGLGGSYTMITLNGSIDAPHERNGRYGGFVPSPESVQEVKVQTAMYDAESGDNGGVNINTVLRSGTNDYHGAAYFIFRNTYMDANTYERASNEYGQTNPKSPTPRANGTWDQPGAVLDGPIRIPHLYDGRDKTFFTVAYERVQLRLYQSSGSTDLVPTQAMKNGDFSALCTGGFNSSGTCISGTQIYDPLTADANGNRTPFLNNQIPQNRWSNTGVALMKYYPDPNATATSTANYNYIAATPLMIERYYSVVTRVDQSIRQNDKLSAVWYRGILGQQAPNMGFPSEIGPSGEDQHVYRNNMGGSLDYIAMLPRNWVLDGRLGVIYHPFGDVYAGSPFDLSKLGMDTSGIEYQTFPGISMSDSYATLQAGSASQISTDADMSGDLIASKTLGTHFIRFGASSLIERYNGTNPLSGLGTFAYSRTFTELNSLNTQFNDSTSGNAMAALLLGYPTSGSYSAQIAFALKQAYQGYFFQDTWRATRNLTLNMGLRWDYQTPFTDSHNRLTTGFCTTCTNPLQAQVSGLTLLGGLEFASPSNRNYYKPERNDWQPRFGVSYSLASNVVLHAGLGITYVNSMVENPIGNGFSTSTTYEDTSDDTHPLNSLDKPFPNGTVAPSGSSLGLSTLVGQGFSFISPVVKRPKLFQWSASTQIALPANTTFQIAYSANRVYYTETSKNINALPAQYDTGTPANATAMQTKVPNPLAGKIPSNGTLNASTIQQSSLLEPFPEFGTLTEVLMPTGGSLYNSLQLTARKSMYHGLSILGTFTWSRQMDQNTYLNATDPAPERYLDPQPNLLGNIALIYQLPRFSRLPYYARSVLGGWQFNSIFRDYNGPLVGTPASVSYISEPRIGHPTNTRYFNTCYLNSAGQPVDTKYNANGTIATPGCDAMSPIPAFEQHNNFALNNIGPYMNHVRVPPGRRVDVSLFKVFQIHENMTLEIRGEYFNVLNTPLFGGPNLSPGNAAYGARTLTQANDPRLGQLTARINF